MLHDTVTITSLTPCSSIFVLVSRWHYFYCLPINAATSLELAVRLRIRGEMGFPQGAAFQGPVVRPVGVREARDQVRMEIPLPREQCSPFGSLL